MKTLAAIIHARKDSTRCPNKHLRDLNGTTLIDIALENLIFFLTKKEITFFSTNFTILKFTSDDNLMNLVKNL